MNQDFRRNGAWKVEDFKIDGGKGEGIGGFEGKVKDFEGGKWKKDEDWESENLRKQYSGCEISVLGQYLAYCVIPYFDWRVDRNFLGKSGEPLGLVVFD